ncbi:MAG: aminomethyltransferase beta-barrel domain-containing protein, partial [Pseudomonadota bacterium]
GCDANKDQSYFLFALGRERLARAFFPLGGLRKPEVRARAAALGLPCATRPGSQDACFGGGEGFAEALRRHFGDAARGGELLAPDGRLLGPHAGLHRYTIGQRRGLGVALGRPAWVSAIDAARAEVTVTTREEDLLAAGLVAQDPTWLVEPPDAGEPVSCEVQVRYRARPVPAEATVSPDGCLTVRFSAPVRAVTPGQAAVLYRGERVLGGAWITAALPGSLAPRTDPR